MNGGKCATHPLKSIKHAVYSTICILFGMLPQYQWQMKGLEGSISKNVTILIVICIPGGGKVSIPNFTVIIYINIINLQPSNKGKIIENYNYNYKLPFKVTLARITIIWVAQFTEHHLQAGVFMHIAMPKIVAKQLEIPSIDLSKEPIEQHQQVGWTCSLYVFLWIVEHPKTWANPLKMAEFFGQTINKLYIIYNICI